MMSQAWGLSARPAVAEFGDKYIDLSTSKKYVYTQSGWVEEGAPIPEESFLLIS